MVTFFLTGSSSWFVTGGGRTSSFWYIGDVFVGDGMGESEIRIEDSCTKLYLVQAIMQ